MYVLAQLQKSQVQDLISHVKKLVFGLRLSEGNFPFMMGERFACQHGDTFGAFGLSAFEGIKDGLLFYLLETALFKETANRLTF